MIKLYDGQITDLLPEKLAENTDIKCLSYAIQKEHQRLLDLADGTRTMSFIAGLSEEILDILAIELRAPYYDDTLDISVKRDIIVNTLKWHTKAGTPAAVQELVEIVFGEGKVIEWWNFEDDEKTPGTFDIETNAKQTADELDRFASIIQRVKNTRSHLRAIKTHRSITGTLYVAGAYTASNQDVVGNWADNSHVYAGLKNYAAGFASLPNDTVINSTNRTGSGMAGGISGGCRFVSLPRTTIIARSIGG
jgi:phage tail P2-like protein